MELLFDNMEKNLAKEPPTPKYTFVWNPKNFNKLSGHLRFKQRIFLKSCVIKSCFLCSENVATKRVQSLHGFLGTIISEVGNGVSFLFPIMSKN